MIPFIDSWTAGANIQRCMRLLAAGTAAKRSHVKILFYGQSITRQDWWNRVVERLKKRFPYADIDAENRAIGGFAANLLKDVVQHDLLVSYPDLVILHNYGGDPDYEELLKNIRRSVASEILVQSDHLNWLGKPGEAIPRAQAWHDQHARWLEGVARRDRLGFVDVRERWRAHLLATGLRAEALLSDQIHLNDSGCALMADIIDAALTVDPRLETSNLVTETAIEWRKLSSRITFTGNRIDLVLSAPTRSKISVSIDGRSPSVRQDTLAVTRPSDTFKCDVPGVFRIDHDAPLIAEDWTLTLHDVSRNGDAFRFDVRGSVTGPDGEGVYGQDFRSRSGRVVIPARAWYVKEASRIVHAAPPEGFQFHWSVVRQSVDEVPAGAWGSIRLAVGLSPGPHTIELRSQIPTPSGSLLRVWRPPLP